VPSSPSPAEDAAARGTMPASVRVAVVVTSLLAGILLLYVAVTLLGRDGIVTALTESQSQLTRAEAERYVVINAAAYGVVGLLFAVTAWFLPRRHPWARWIGLAVMVAVALMMLFSMITAGGVVVSSLLLLVLSVAGITSLAAKSTGEWMPRLRAQA
jgi:hypothetical protein